MLSTTARTTRSFSTSSAWTPLFLAGALTLMVNLRASPAQFAQAKTWVVVGGTVGFLVWFLGFAVIGGEWFQMWQSQTWNGQEPAFRFVMTILVVVIFI